VVGVIIGFVIWLLTRPSSSKVESPPLPSLGGDKVENDKDDDDPKNWSIERLNYEIQQVTGKLNELDGMLYNDNLHGKK
jgi:hypothetical protein